MNETRERVETLPPEPDAPDVAALDEALAYIQAHPGQWQQDTWRCRSGMCLAGWTGELGGATWVADVDGLTPTGPVCTIEGDELGLFGHDLVKAEGEVVAVLWMGQVGHIANATPVSEWARRRLGLTQDQAAELFHAENNMTALLAMRDRLAANPSRETDLYLGQDWHLEHCLGRDRAVWEEL